MCFDDLTPYYQESTTWITCTKPTEDLLLASGVLYLAESSLVYKESKSNVPVTTWFIFGLLFPLQMIFTLLSDFHCTVSPQRSISKNNLNIERIHSLFLALYEMLVTIRVGNMHGFKFWCTWIYHPVTGSNSQESWLQYSLVLHRQWTCQFFFFFWFIYVHARPISFGFFLYEQIPPAAPMNHNQDPIQCQPIDNVLFWWG